MEDTRQEAEAGPTAPQKRVDAGETDTAPSVNDIAALGQTAVTHRDRDDGYRRLFEEMPQGAFRQRADGSLVDVNPAALRMFGLTRDDFLGRTSLNAEWEVIGEDGSPLPGLEHPSMVALQTGKPVKGRTLAVRHSGTGEWIWMEVNAIPEFSPGDDAPCQVVVTLHDITRHRQAERQLQRREAEVRALLLASRAVLTQESFAAAARAVFDQCRAALGAESGYIALLTDDGQENDVLFLEAGGRPCSVDPDSRMPIRGLRAEAYRTGKAICENRFASSQWARLLPDGHVALDNVLFAPLNVNGRTVGLLGLANKPGGFAASDLALAEAFGEMVALALRRAQDAERLRETIDNLAAGVAVYRVVEDGRDFVFADINRAGARIGHRSREEHIGRSVQDVYPAVQEMGVFAALQRVARTGDPEHLPVSLYRDHRMVLWAENYIFRLPSGEVVAVYEDKTDAQQAMQALAESEKRFRLLHEMLPVGYQSLDPKGHVLDVNEAWLAMTGYGRTDVIGRWFGDFLVGPAADLFRERFETFKSSGRALTEFQMRHADGTVREVLFVGRAATDADGAFVRSHCIATDITEQKRLEAQYRQAQKMEAVGRLAAGVAHDFNNQLTVILGYCEMLLNDRAEGDPLWDPLSQVRQAARRAQSTTSHLLSFSRRQVLQPEVVDAVALLHEMQGPVSKMVGEDIALKVVCDPGVPSLHVDRIGLHQALMNLIVNARDAMPRGGTLTLRLSRANLTSVQGNRLEGIGQGEYVLLAVEDSGCGMDDAMLERIVEPFFTTKEPGKGTGLGVPMVKGFAEQSRGFLRFVSQVGKGTTAQLYLPPAENDRARPTSASEFPEPAPRHAAGSTILVVEDEDSLRRLVVRALQAQGYEVLAAADPAAAMVLASNRAPLFDLLLTDVIMPGMDGFELARHLRRSNPSLAVLYMTGYTADEPDDTTPTIRKPFSVKDLVSAVQLRLAPGG